MFDETGGYTRRPGHISGLSASIAAEVSASDKPDPNLSREKTHNWPGLKRLFCHRTAVRTVVSENNSLFGEKRQHGDHTVGLQESRLESWNRGMNLGKWNNNSLTWIVGPFGDHFPYEPWFPGRGRSEVVMKFTQDQHGLFAEAPGTGWPIAPAPQIAKSPQSKGRALETSTCHAQICPAPAEWSEC